MSQTLLNQILTQLHALELTELQQLNQTIQQYLNNKEVSANRTVFHQALLGSGLVRQIKNPNFVERKDQYLIQIQDEPISQTIIGERR